MGPVDTYPALRIFLLQFSNIHPIALRLLLKHKYKRSKPSRKWPREEGLEELTGQIYLFGKNNWS